MGSLSLAGKRFGYLLQGIALPSDLDHPLVSIPALQSPHGPEAQGEQRQHEQNQGRWRNGHQDVRTHAFSPIENRSIARMAASQLFLNGPCSASTSMFSATAFRSAERKSATARRNPGWAMKCAL